MKSKGKSLNVYMLKFIKRGSPYFIRQNVYGSGGKLSIKHKHASIGHAFL